MGTNFYLRRVKPREVYDEYHIAKRSAGWRIHFQNSDWYHPSEPNNLTEPGRYAPCQLHWPDEGEVPPHYRSVADIRALLESGEFQLADEYGTTWGAGAASVAEFEELCRWMGGSDLDGKECSAYQDGEPPWEGAIRRGDYRDPEGFLFTDVEFS